MILKCLCHYFDFFFIGEKKVTAGYLLPTFHVLKRNLEKLKTDRSIIRCQCLIESILQSIEDRFGTYFSNDSLIIAAIVHPAFRVSWIKPEKLKAQLNCCEMKWRLKNLELVFQRQNTLKMTVRQGENVILLA